jgi:hypothetical protein
MLRWTKTSLIALRFVDSDEHGKRQNNERKLSHFDSPRPRAKKLNKPNFRSLALPCHAKEKTYVPLSWHDFSRAHGMVTRRCSKNRGQWVTRFACQLPPTICPKIPAPTSNLTLIFRISFVALFPYQKSLIKHCSHNGRILLANLLQSSKSTFSWGNFLSFFAFKEGMSSTPISVLGGWPTVSGGFLPYETPKSNVLTTHCAQSTFMGYPSESCMQSGRNNTTEKSGRVSSFGKQVGSKQQRIISH